MFAGLFGIFSKSDASSKSLPPKATPILVQLNKPKTPALQALEAEFVNQTGNQIYNSLVHNTAKALLALDSDVILTKLVNTYYKEGVGRIPPRNSYLSLLCQFNADIFKHVMLNRELSDLISDLDLNLYVVASDNNVRIQEEVSNDPLLAAKVDPRFLTARAQKVVLCTNTPGSLRS